MPAPDPDPAKLDATERRFRDLIEGSIQGILVHRNFQVLFANDALARIWGFDCAENMIGVDLIDFLPPDHTDFWKEGYRNVIEGRPVRNPREVQIFRPDGEPVWVERIHRRVLWDGEPALQATVSDISVRKASELALRNALAEIENLKDQLESENRYLRAEIESARSSDKILGESSAMKSALHRVHRVAPTDATVLISGETGTGKELLARAVHAASTRSDRPLIKVNCGALPSELIESELFGHERGAFTGAHQQRTGRFELADGGTLLLDEVGELPLELQAKLLRVLQEGEIERLGGEETLHVDVRVIAATNRDLTEDVAAGRFREDLFYRLNVFPIRSPALRERLEDVALLAHHFAARYAEKINRPVPTIPADILRRLEAYGWPGNVRELQNVIERCMIITDGPELQLDLDLRLPAFDEAGAAPRTVQETERSAIRAALKRCDWVIEGSNGAAQQLDLAPSTLRGRMRKHGIKRPLHR